MMDKQRLKLAKKVSARPMGSLGAQSLIRGMLSLEGLGLPIPGALSHLFASGIWKHCLHLTVEIDSEQSKPGATHQFTFPTAELTSTVSWLP